MLASPPRTHNCLNGRFRPSPERVKARPGGVSPGEAGAPAVWHCYRG